MIAIEIIGASARYPREMLDAVRTATEPEWLAAPEGRAAARAIAGHSLYESIVDPEWHENPSGNYFAYYDTAGSQGSSTPLFVAGAVSTVGQWERFDQEWNDVLDQFGVPLLHMKEYTVSRGPYAGWRDDSGKRTAFLVALSKVMRRWINRVILFGIPPEDFRAVDGQYQLTEAVHNPYSLAAC